MASRTALVLSLLSASGLAACSDSENKETPDAGVPADAAPDSGPTCDPTTVLPSNYRVIAKVSTGVVNVATTNNVTSGTIDATAGGIDGAADNPYIYVDLKNNVRVDVSDVDARTSTNWDIALKRSSLRVNSGDSGPGNRKLTTTTFATLAEVTAAPTTGYKTDDFTTDDCKLDSIPGGEPMSAFGEWYDYDPETHIVSPKPEVYVLERNNGTHVAFRIDAYYGDPDNAQRGAFYRVEWKNL